MKFLSQDLQPLGMGCWPIGGEMFANGKPVGYANADDAESLRTIHAALAAGLRVFDTAAGYGAGHSERVLGEGLKGCSDAIVITKIGQPIDEDKRQFTGEPFLASDVIPAIDASRRRLDRDQVDVMLLHVNTMDIDEAKRVFDQMNLAVELGKIRYYGWSTDFTDRVEAMADQPNFKVIEHAMNLFFDAPRVQKAVRAADLTALIRSPLAMGLLSGKYDITTKMPKTDIRSTPQSWMPYYTDGGVDPTCMATLNAVRDLLTIGGRSLVQGSLAWIWGKHANNVPVPGARTATQIEELAGALDAGPLPHETMLEIEKLIEREPEDTPDRER